MSSHLTNSVVPEIDENGAGISREIDAASPGEFVKALLLGLIATLLFSMGLYIVISGLVIIFMTGIRWLLW